MERTRTGIKSLKVGYNKVFGYYIEISRGASERAPENYIRKQTLVNGERYITSEMKEYETLVLNAEDRIHEIEARIFRDVCATLAKSCHGLLRAARALAELDVLASLAEVAATCGYARPEMTSDTELDIRAGRHPVVEQLLQSERYVPNDAIFGEGEIVRIITGPNMSGKSTYLRKVALIALRAQMGWFVPAESARIGLVDRIFTRIGAQDEIHGSTFLAYAALAAQRGQKSVAYPTKGFYYLGGLTEATETIACFALMCLWPQHFAAFAYGFAALCALTIATRLAAGWRGLPP